MALDSEVLMLDDLGAHRVTDWVQDTITAIVTHRCNHQMPLIATTNLPDADVEGSKTIQRGTVGIEYRRTLRDHIGDRARSRLFEMCNVIHMPNIDDYRIRRGKGF
jgi:DNA replication protein DnaC